MAAHAAVAPEVLPALQALLGAVLQLQTRPRPLRPLAALLRLLLAAISTFGRVLGAPFVSGALHGTVSAVDVVLAEQVEGAAGALALGGDGGGGGEEASGLEALIFVSLRLLKLAADPPLSKPSERSALTEQVLGACKPGRMGWLLGGAADLAPALRLQVFGRPATSPLLLPMCSPHPHRPAPLAAPSPRPPPRFSAPSPRPRRRSSRWRRACCRRTGRRCASVRRS